MATPAFAVRTALDEQVDVISRAIQRATGSTAVLRPYLGEDYDLRIEAEHPSGSLAAMVECETFLRYFRHRSPVRVVARHDGEQDFPGDPTFSGYAWIEVRYVRAATR